MDRFKPRWNISTVLTVLFLFIFVTVGLYVLWLGIAAFLKASPNVQASIVAGSLALAGTLYTAHYNARRAREQAAFEAHRRIKVELYRHFLGKLSEMIESAIFDSENNKMREKKSREESLKKFFNEFVWDLLLFGGPNVVRVFSEWKSQENAGNLDRQQANLLILGKLIKEMRKDIGETNEKIDEQDILGALLQGGRSVLDSLE